MRQVTDKKDALKILDVCRKHKVGLLAPCCESTAEIEGILMAAQSWAETHNIAEVPVAVGFTGVYPDNAQLVKVSTFCEILDGASKLRGGDVCQGFDIMVGLFQAYANIRGAFDRVAFLPFLDHGWPIGDVTDNGILESRERLAQLAVVMYDCSMYELDENMKRVARYVDKFGDVVVVEAAVDKLYTPAEAKALGITRADSLSKPDVVEKYVRETGVDLAVPNLGTEHRVTSESGYVKKYESTLAQKISGRVGKILVIHGTSCLGNDIGTLVNDGAVKINIYTAMAVGGGNAVYKALKSHEDIVVKNPNLAINSPTYTHDVRRRYVAGVIKGYFEKLGYSNLPKK